MILNNAFALNNDHTCFLPVVRFEDRHTTKETGTWRWFVKDKKQYVEIITDSEEFAGVYKISGYRKYRDPESLGVLAEMTLQSERVRMECRKALY